MKKLWLILVVAMGLSTACKKEDPAPPADSGQKLVFKYKFDPNQERLNNFGQPAEVPAEHGAQTPFFRGMSAHYIELAPSALTQLGAGEVVFFGPETTMGGSSAIDFAKSVIKGDGEVFFSVPLKNVTPGTYDWARVSLAYQNYDINFRWDGFDYIGSVASFVAYRTYIQKYKIKNQEVTINANKDQGYWGFEATFPGFGTYWIDGQAPATTVPNPLFATSPIPPGSCVVTGPFDGGLVITGNETKDIVVTLSFSIKNSFEWYDVDQNNIYETQAGDYPVDMGVRGLRTIIQY